MLLALVLLVAAPIAQDAQPVEKPKKEARTCRRLGNTGSRMDEKRICRTKSQWASIDTANNINGIDANHTGEEERNRGNK